MYTVTLINFQEEEPKNQEEEDENSQHKGRRHIHKLLKEQKLLGETKAAAKAEKVRRERLKKVHQQVRHPPFSTRCFLSASLKHVLYYISLG